MWLVEKVTFLENQNEELKKALQEMEMRLATQENTARQADERHARIEAAITRIAEVVQQQNTAIEVSKASMISLVEEVNNHRDNFQKVAMIMQVHEQHIVQSGVITQEMAQYINAHIKENEQANLRIGSLTRDSQTQTQVLRQHHLGQQVLAEVIKGIMAGQQQTQQQPPQGQTVTGAGPTVTEVDGDDDPDRLDFMGGPGSPRRTADWWGWAGDNETTQDQETQDDPEETLSKEVVYGGEPDVNDLKHPEKTFVNKLIEKTIAVMNEEVLDQKKTVRHVERIVILGISTKHINLWIRQLELKRMETCHLAGLMGFDLVKNEIEMEKCLERRAKRTTNHFTKKTKRMLCQEIDIMCGVDKKGKLQDGASRIRCTTRSRMKK